LIYVAQASKRVRNQTKESETPLLSPQHTTNRGQSTPIKLPKSINKQSN